ncbi:MAG: hypothetical protein HC912_04655 [Saprospiraceae bacterium]|nr:hypothetical protein [Saprospiraceae bacterium]
MLTQSDGTRLIPMTGFPDNYLPTIRIRFNFWDKEKEKSGDLTLELDSFNSTEAKWILRNREVLGLLNGLVGGKPWDSGFSVPTDLTLYKVE